MGYRKLQDAIEISCPEKYTDRATLLRNYLFRVQLFSKAMRGDFSS